MGDLGGGSYDRGDHLVKRFFQTLCSSSAVDTAAKEKKRGPRGLPAQGSRRSRGRTETKQQKGEK